MEKVCKTCGITKLLEEFPKHKRYKDGYYGHCKLCNGKKTKEWELKNNDKKKEIRTRYRENNREEIREKDRENYRKDPEKFRAKARKNQAIYFKTPKGKEKYKIQGEILRKKYPEKARARSLLSNAVCDGKIIRPNKCSLCLCENSKIEAHHPDYSRPYDVVWLCKSCHFVVHGRIKIHRERLNPETPKGDAIVQPSEETTREESEAVLPPS